MSQQESSQYQEESSLDIIVEFGQINSDIVGSVVRNNRNITGLFGVAEIFENKCDRMLVVNTDNQDIKLVNKVYRGIVVKNNKKKQNKNNAELKNNQQRVDEDEENVSQNMFDSPDISQQELKKQKSKSKDQTMKKLLFGKTRIIRRIRTLSKKQQNSQKAS